ncbi:MAG: hypothetical protein VB142_12165 [Burkholderia sp.]
MFSIALTQTALGVDAVQVHAERGNVAFSILPGVTNSKIRSTSVATEDAFARS